MKKFGLIGKSLNHSFSKKYFTEKFEKEGINASYELFELENISELRNLFERENLTGANVTIPYKEEVIPFLDRISGEAKSIGAVNTVKKEGNNLMGYNTDYYGFKTSLQNFLGEEKPKALILGTGGAAKAVSKVCEDLKINFQLISRNKKNGLLYAEMNEKLLKKYKLIINTTPLGMHPNINRAPEINYNFITDKHFCYDLIYNPEEALFLKKCKMKRAKVKNGMEMLHLQAEKSWKIWNS